MHEYVCLTFCTSNRSKERDCFTVHIYIYMCGNKTHNYTQFSLLNSVVTCRQCARLKSKTFTAVSPSSGCWESSDNETQSLFNQSAEPHLACGRGRNWKRGRCCMASIKRDNLYNFLLNYQRSWINIYQWHLCYILGQLLYWCSPDAVSKLFIVENLPSCSFPPCKFQGLEFQVPSLFLVNAK